ncbi:TIGR03756 family integrating conjugative element protein, partial [Pseudomonas sp. xss_2]
MNLTAPCRTPQPKKPGRGCGYIAIALLVAAGQCLALTTPAIIASVTSLQCLEYRIVGICYWLLCSP